MSDPPPPELFLFVTTSGSRISECANTTQHDTMCETTLIWVIAAIFSSCRDLVLSEFQIARAKAEGATGITIVVSLVGPERSAELSAFCKKLGECVQGFV